MVELKKFCTAGFVYDFTARIVTAIHIFEPQPSVFNRSEIPFCNLNERSIVRHHSCRRRNIRLIRQVVVVPRGRYSMKPEINVPFAVRSLSFDGFCSNVDRNISVRIRSISVYRLRPNIDEHIAVRAGDVPIHASNMGTNGPFNHAVRNDLTMRDISRIKQLRARLPRLRAFEEALVLEGAVHLVADLVRR